MTIAICIKVHDGVVLAADSAATVFFSVGEEVREQVYNYANKVFNLYKGLPVGMVTWGHGGIGSASTSTLTKDFRELITNNPEWKIDENNYTIEEIVDKLLLYFHDKKYTKEFGDSKEPTSPFIGFIVAGYSAKKGTPEVWTVLIGRGYGRQKSEVEAPIVWAGEKEMLSRIVLGYSESFLYLLKEVGLSDEDLMKILDIFEDRYNFSWVHPAMPIQDAIDLADFLVQAAINYARFRPGAPTIGGPVDIAAITKHEGFKWVKRKHYYSRDLNPEG
ncbi:MAG: hypothetical protein H0Z28_13865 [Archaeoglobus sp.]|nr:hypothetical protein [Archaeoglobus sp.]